MSGKVLFGLLEIAAAVFVIYLLFARPAWFLRSGRQDRTEPREHDFRDLGIGTAAQRDASVRRAKFLAVVFVVILLATIVTLWSRGAFR